MVTICAVRHGCYFDKFPELKEIIDEEIIYTQKYFKNIDISDVVVMPNHMHLIVEICYQVENVTLGRIINVLKSRVVNRWLKIIEKEKINCIACVFQRNYFEHRIRNNSELEKYVKYIKNNPKNWSFDRYNPINLKCSAFACQNPDKQEGAGC